MIKVKNAPNLYLQKKWDSSQIKTWIKYGQIIPAVVRFSKWWKSTFIFSHISEGSPDSSCHCCYARTGRGCGCCAGWSPVLHWNPWAPICFGIYNQNNWHPHSPVRIGRPSSPVRGTVFHHWIWVQQHISVLKGALRMPQMKWACFVLLLFQLSLFFLFASFPQNHFHLIWITFWPHSLKDEWNCLHSHNQGKVHCSEKMGDPTVQYYPGSWWCINVG